MPAQNRARRAAPRPPRRAAPRLASPRLASREDAHGLALIGVDSLGAAIAKL